MSTVVGASFAFAFKDFEARALETAGDVFAPRGAVDPAAKRFLEQLHDDAVADDLEDLAVDDMVFLAADFWTWARERKSGETKVRCHPGRHADGRPMRRDILEIVTADKPFLVGSVMGEINEQGVNVLAMFHPVISLERDDAGARAAQGAAQGGGAPRVESMMHVHLQPLDDESRERLIAALRVVLDDVDAAVTDFGDMRARMDHAIEELKTAHTSASSEELEEAIAFLRWLRDDNFAFLGCRVYAYSTSLDGELARDEPTIVPDTSRGVLRDETRRVLRRGSEPVVITEAVQEFLREPSPLIVAKSNERSRVHRRGYMDYVGVKRYRADGAVIGETRFVGLFTASAYHAPVTEVPLIRRKVRRVFERAQKGPESHSFKLLRSIIETYPRDEIFQSDENEILEIALGVLHLFDRPRPKLFIRRDRFDRFLSALVYVPRERYNSSLRVAVGRLLAESYGGRLSAFYPYFGEGPLARVHFIIGLNPYDHPEPDPRDVEVQITELARTWEDEFVRIAREEAPATLRPRLARYEHAFSAGYRETVPPREALDDVAAIEAIDPLIGLGVRATRDPDGHALLRFRVYRQGGELALSDIMPTLETMGLEVVSESRHSIRRGAVADEDPGAGVVWMYDFAMRSVDGAVDVEAVKAVFEDAFMATWLGHNECDGFNRLVLALGVGWRDVAFLRTCARYRQQTGLDPSQAVQEQALCDNPDIARLILELRTVRFDPAYAKDLDARRAREEEVKAAIAAALDAVESLDADRVLRRLATLVGAVQRTNFYQTDADGWPKPTIAIKIASRELDHLPEPKPFREVFVWSPRVEGVHIRFGPVARGGLRWSDRRDDFRTEVMGLVKAQFVKNAVIVPVGAKGGFFPKELPRIVKAGGDREAVMAEGVAAYKLFIGALLDVTDNIVDDAVLRPHKVVAWDEDDPYLVVAADKGTATFSDTANAISEERGFWLGDAFASGGSAGYDHKKMGITARGAWEAVKRHFRERGKDIQTEPFTVIGVGDMSGDVFGNGMLLSKQIKLLAAFDHRDIFIDPHPTDTERCWNERKRLFDMGRSSWKDYDGSLISHGGGVFSRALKAIPLTTEMRELTGLEGDHVTPSELVRALMKSPCELLWFGGIGTYIKAASETDAQVGDKANDAVRVNAVEVGAEVIGEGANLGVTQAGRIALARRGVALNADFIDNAAGVDSSDHEVNIKILLNPIVRAGRMSVADRNKLLESMTDDVAAHVLKHNYDQTLALSLAEAAAVEDLDSYERMIERMEARGLLNRRNEGLPTSDQFREIKAQGVGLTRPEIAVLVSYAKISLFDRILQSDAPDDPHCDALLAAYFPSALAAFKDDMHGHRLRREIISTVLANDIINLGGATFTHRAGESTGADIGSITRAFEAARVIFGFSELLERIHGLDASAPAGVQMSLYQAAISLLRRQTYWLLRRGRGFEQAEPRPLQETIDAYKPGVDELRGIAMEVLSPFEVERVDGFVDTLVAAGAPEALALEVGQMHTLTSSTDLIDLSHNGGHPLIDVARIYHAVGDRFRFDKLRAAAGGLSSPEHWDRLAVRRLMEDLYGEQQAISALILNAADAPSPDPAWVTDSIEGWIAENAYEAERLEKALDEYEPGGWTLSKLALSVMSLREFATLAKS